VRCVYESVAEQGDVVQVQGGSMMVIQERDIEDALKTVRRLVGQGCYVCMELVGYGKEEVGYYEIKYMEKH